MIQVLSLLYLNTDPMDFFATERQFSMITASKPRLKQANENFLPRLFFWK